MFLSVNLILLDSDTLRLIVVEVVIYSNVIFIYFSKNVEILGLELLGAEM